MLNVPNNAELMLVMSCCGCVQLYGASSRWSSLRNKLDCWANCSLVQ